MRTFVRVRDAAKATGIKEKTIYEQIRTGIFPFRIKRAGRAILIYARDLDLIPDKPAEDHANQEAREQESSLATAA